MDNQSSLEHGTMFDCHAHRLPGRLGGTWTTSRRWNLQVCLTVKHTDCQEG
jgi:hypothetical protein